MPDGLNDDGLEKQKTGRMQRPLLGVFTGRKQISTMLNQKPNERLRRLAEANEYVDIGLYFFSLHHISWEKRLIAGAYYNAQEDRWRQQAFPYPDVFYNRGGVSKKSRKIYERLIEVLQDNGCKFLNHLYGFNKWEVYQLLEKDTEIFPYLPETRLYKRAKSLRDMLDIHGTVYLKACIGRKGQQVMRVRKISHRAYEYRYFINRLKVGKVTFGGLVSTVRRFFKSKKFIIQEAISLPDTNGSKMDLRAEMQRDGSGTLEIIGISVREGQTGSPITTHAKGVGLIPCVFFSFFFTQARTTLYNRRVKRRLCDARQSF